MPDRLGEPRPVLSPEESERRERAALGVAAELRAAGCPDLAVYAERLAAHYGRRKRSLAERALDLARPR